MLNKRIPASITITCMLLCQINVLAAVEQIGDKEVRVSGEFGADGANKAYFVNVYAPGKSVENLDSADDADNTDVLSYHKQFTADEYGNYDFTFKIDGSSGQYTIQIYSPVAEAMLEDEILEFINEKEFEETIKVLNTKSTENDIAEYIEQNRAALGFSFDEIAPLENREIARIISNEFRDEKFSETSFIAAKKQFCTIALVAALNKNKLSNAFTYFSMYSDKTGALPKYLSQNDTYVIDESLQKKITASLSGKSFDTVKQFVDEMWCQFVLNVTYRPNGVDNLREILKASGEFTGIDERLYTDTKLNSIIGKTFGSVSKLKEELNKKESSDSQSSGGGGGGGKSSGGGGSNGVSVVGFPNTGNETDITPIPVDVFVDLEEAIWARNAIVMLTNKGILSGKTNDRFFPNDYVTREEFAKMLVCAFAPDAETVSIDFSDIEISAWYYPYIAKAYGLGYITGYDDGRFGVGDRITRQDMVTMAYRASSELFTNSDDGELQFDDADEISDYAKEAVLAFTSKEIVNGMGDNMFAPGAFATRAQAAKILYGLID